MPHLALRAALLVLLATAGAAHALQSGPAARAVGPWAQFRGPGGQGVSLEKGLPTRWSESENLVWKTALPGPGTSSPIVVGDRILLTCYTGSASGGLGLHVLSLNRADGKLVWKRDIAPQLPEQDRIREDHGWASSTLAADADRIYAFFGKSGVFAFDHSGKQLWRAGVGSGLNGWGSSNSPVLHGNLVIINASVESESLVALDRATGREVWRAGGIKESWNTPILVNLPGGKTELVTAVFGKVLGFDPATGQQLWSCNTDIGWYMVPSLVSRNGVVYCIGGRTAGGLAVRCGGRGDVTATHRVWTARKGSNVSSPVLSGDHMYWVHENLGIAYCAELSTGKLLYEERLPPGGQFYASPIVAEGRVYYMGRFGKSCVVAATPQFQLLGTGELGNREVFNASPAAADGRLYYRSDRHLYCLGAR